MVKIYSIALDKSMHIDRVLGEIKTNKKGPVVVFFAGIHGNETAGIFALEEVFKNINPAFVNGTICAIIGNLKALEQNQRYLDEDLNRIWIKEQLESTNIEENLNSERTEQLEVLRLLKEIINSSPGPFYFIDFHTTSSKSVPFITINDTLINRNFARLFPIPIVLGIEEYLNGPLLSYINELGYIALGFESGQHDEIDAISNCVAFVYLTLIFISSIDLMNVINFQTYYNQFRASAMNLEGVYEIVYLHHVKNGEFFKMKEGFESFQDIKKGTILATNNNTQIVSNYNAKIFMPLYQSKGEDGFFVIKTIHPFFLNLSTLFRRLRVASLLVCLPGISWEDQKKESLKANLKIVKFFANPFFHLLGYRNKKINANYMLLYNREHAAKDLMYKNEAWQKNLYQAMD